MKPCMQSVFLSVGFLLALASTTEAQSTRSVKPNFLIIMADDCTYNDLPIYGGKNALTPNINQLAREGLTFNRCYLSSAMCQPCRAELFTGKYPMNNGCAWNHSACLPGTLSLPHYLTPLGYRVGISGKVHVLPEKSFPFENVQGFDPSCVRNPTKTHELEGIKEFMERDRKAPFCLVVALVEPHVPWVMGDASKYPAAKLNLPPNIADTPKTRQNYGQYLAEITYMDNQVGEILSVLRASGKESETVVLFTSEQGSQFPGCKWTVWDTGLHTALIARYPDLVSAGQRTDVLVQYADIVPTILELAGQKAADVPKKLDGLSFVANLRGERLSRREYVYGTHNNIPEGTAYPSRTVSNGEWRYIRNLTPNEIFIEKHLMGIQAGGELNNPYWPTWIATAGDTSDIYRLVKRYMLRPPEELYHTLEDPYEMNNLVDDPKFQKIKNRLSVELDRWLVEQGDPGIRQDTHEAHQAAKTGEHKYRPPK